MEEQDVLATITARLRVEVEKTSEYGYGGDVDQYITVKLLLDDKVISSDSVRID